MAETFRIPEVESFTDALNAIWLEKFELLIGIIAEMFGAVAGGAYKTVEVAQNAMTSGFKATYSPRDEFRQAHKKRYELFTDAVRNNETLLRSLR